MKRIITIIIALLFFSPLPGQFNIQHHYDIGRQIFTSTPEFLFFDQLGSTFGFMDINYDDVHYSKPGATDAYFEVARYFKTPLLNENLSATIQYNDGVILLPESDTTLFSAVNRVWMGGFSYLFPIEKLSFSTDFLARQEEGDKGLTYQVTFVWSYQLTNHFVLMGFMDIWNTEKDKTLIFQGEPQVLYNFGKLAIGSEIKVSRNFPAAWTHSQEYKENKLFFIPTVFIKYTF